MLLGIGHGLGLGQGYGYMTLTRTQKPTLALPLISLLGQQASRSIMATGTHYTNCDQVTLTL